MSNYSSIAQILEDVNVYYIDPLECPMCDSVDMLEDDSGAFSCKDCGCEVEVVRTK